MEFDGERKWNYGPNDEDYNFFPHFEEVEQRKRGPIIPLTSPTGRTQENHHHHLQVEVGAKACHALEAYKSFMR